MAWSMPHGGGHVLRLETQTVCIVSHLELLLVSTRSTRTKSKALLRSVLHSVAPHSARPDRPHVIVLLVVILALLLAALLLLLLVVILGQLAAILGRDDCERAGGERSGGEQRAERKKARAVSGRARRVAGARVRGRRAHPCRGRSRRRGTPGRARWCRSRRRPRRGCRSRR